MTTDTPRTDSRTIPYPTNNLMINRAQLVDADFARQLERELQAAIADRDSQQRVCMRMIEERDAAIKRAHELDELYLATERHYKRMEAERDAAIAAIRRLCAAQVGFPLPNMALVDAVADAQQILARYDASRTTPHPPTGDEHA